MAEKHIALDNDESAQRDLTSAKTALKSALQEAVASSITDPLRESIKSEMQAQMDDAISNLSSEYSAAAMAVLKAKEVEMANATPENTEAVKDAETKANSLKLQLEAAREQQKKEKDTKHPSETPIEELQTQVNVALEEKTAAENLAMTEPTDEHLNTFRQNVRSVHDLQTKMLMAKEALLRKEVPSKEHASLNPS